MTNITRIDHKQQARELMLSQYGESPKLLALLDSWIGGFQGVEDALLSFIDNNGITNATGVMLDIIGEWAGVQRLGRGDTEFRTVILGQLLLQRADGSTEAFHTGMRVLSGSNMTRFYELNPHTVHAHMGRGWNNSTITQLRRISMAGVHVLLAIDEDLDSFRGAEVRSLTTALITGDQEEYLVNVGGEISPLLTSVTENVQPDLIGDEMAEIGDIHWTPLAEVIDREARVLHGFLVDDQDNFIVDDQGNRIAIRALGY